MDARLRACRGTFLAPMALMRRAASSSFSAWSTAVYAAQFTSKLFSATARSHRTRIRDVAFGTSERGMGMLWYAPRSPTHGRPALSSQNQQLAHDITPAVFIATQFRGTSFSQFWMPAVRVGGGTDGRYLSAFLARKPNALRGSSTQGMPPSFVGAIPLHGRAQCTLKACLR